MVLSGKAYVDSMVSTSLFWNLLLGNADCFIVAFNVVLGFTSNINDSLLTICLDFRLRRIKNRAIENPMITITHAPTVPPTVTDRLPEDGYDITEVGVS